MTQTIRVFTVLLLAAFCCGCGESRSSKLRTAQIELEAETKALERLKQDRDNDPEIKRWQSLAKTFEKGEEQADRLLLEYKKLSLNGKDYSREQDRQTKQRDEDRQHGQEAFDHIEKLRKAHDAKIKEQQQKTDEALARLRALGD